MIPLDEARTRLLEEIDPLPPLTLPALEAGGRILAEALEAQLTHPPLDVSAMDGYAVQSTDLGATPARLRLAGESAAGHVMDRPVEEGEAARISTGAAVPDDADQVVIQENTEREGDSVLVQDGPRPGAHIRRAGSDFAEGETLLPAGARLNADAAGLAASAGVTSLLVQPAPRIGLLATGDELVEPGETPGPGQIISSVSKGLAVLVEENGGLAIDLGVARDNEADVRRALGRAEEVDLLVTIGGASVGDHDHLRRVFTQMGGTLWFEKIAVKPGKPTWAGALKGRPVLGLPGNPVSALVLARLLLLPAVGRLEDAPRRPVFLRAPLAAPLPAGGPRETFLRARHYPETGRIAPLPKQDSGALAELAQANALIRRPIGAAAADVGETAEFLPLDGR
jgi:molybdopterin molybdotransferase